MSAAVGERVEEEEGGLGKPSLVRWTLLTKDGPGCDTIGYLSRPLLTFHVEMYNSHLEEAGSLQLLQNFHAPNMLPSKGKQFGHETSLATCPLSDHSPPSICSRRSSSVGPSSLLVSVSS